MPIRSLKAEDLPLCFITSCILGCEFSLFNTLIIDIEKRINVTRLVTSFWVLMLFLLIIFIIEDDDYEKD